MSFVGIMTGHGTKTVRGTSRPTMADFMNAARAFIKAKNAAKVAAKVVSDSQPGVIALMRTVLDPNAEGKFSAVVDGHKVTLVEPAGTVVFGDNVQDVLGDRWEMVTKRTIDKEAFAAAVTLGMITPAEVELITSVKPSEPYVKITVLTGADAGIEAKRAAMAR